MANKLEDDIREILMQVGNDHIRYAQGQPNADLKFARKSLDQATNAIIEAVEKMLPEKKDISMIDDIARKGIDIDDETLQEYNVRSGYNQAIDTIRNKIKGE